METGKISTLSYAAGLERRGAMTVRPGALSHSLQMVARKETGLTRQTDRQFVSGISHLL